MEIMDIMDIMNIMDILEFMIITAWLAMAGAVSALVLGYFRGGHLGWLAWNCRQRYWP